MNNTLKIVWNASLTAFVITLLVGLFVLAMPPSYRATSTIIADANSQVLLRSADLLKEVIDETAVDAAFLRTWTDSLLDRQSDTLNLLRQRLTFRYDNEQGWFEVNVEATDPDIAAQLANAVAVALLRRTASTSVSDTDRGQLQDDLESIESAIIDLMARKPDLRNPAALEASLARQTDQVLDRVQKLESELVDVRAKVAILRSGDLEPVANEPQIRRLLQRQQQLLSRKAELSTRYGARHQKMVSLQAEIDAIENEVEAQIRNAETRAQLELNTISERIAEIEQENNSLEERRLAFSQLRAELNELETQRDRQQMQMRGQTNQVDESRYSAAIPPESSLGFAQIRLMLLVFLASFIIVTSLQWLRPAR